MDEQLMPGLTEGRIVHYVLDTGPNQGQHRPAIVVRDWKQPNGLVQLQVFTDGLNDGFNNEISVKETGWKEAVTVRQVANIIWRTSVIYSEDPKLGTWHWIEKA